MRRRVFEHPAVRRDIAETLQYTEKVWGKRKKDEYKTLIREAIAALRQNPRVARPRPDIHPEARVHRIAQPGRNAAHALLFTITDDDHVVLVRFLNVAQDLPRHFPADYDHTTKPQ